jgi:hypothetical protein
MSNVLVFDADLGAAPQAAGIAAPAAAQAAICNSSRRVFIERLPWIVVSATTGSGRRAISGQ